MNLNKVHLIGRITRDPEIKMTPGGTQVAKTGLATNHIFKGKDDQKKETVQFHNLVAFGKTAEIFGAYVKKGQEIYIEGRIEYRVWDKKDGTGKGSMTEILVESMQMGAKAKGGEAPATEVKNNDGLPSIDVNEDEIKGPDDLPF